MTLAELAECCGGEVRTGPFGSQLHKADYVEETGATPVVMPKNMIDGNIDVGSIARIDDEARERLSQHILSAGDIVLARRGDIGRRAWVGEAESGWLCGTGSMRISLRSCPQIRARYLYYYLGTEAAIGWLEGHSIGATMSNLSAGVVEKLPVEFPDISDQDVIIGVMDSITGLIENNRRRIEILEEMARLIYREWFVHFRFPGHENVKLVDSEHGLVPEGWQVEALSDIVSYVNRGIAPKYDDNSSARVINQRCIRDHRVSLEVARRHTKKVPHEKRVRPGDMLINSTGVGTLGRVAPVRVDLVDTTVDSHVTIVRPRPDVNIHYFAETVLSLEPLFESMGVGSTGQTELSRARIGEAQVIVAPKALRDAYGDLTSPMSQLGVNLAKQNEALTEVRDLLLPRLISGELDVSDLNLDLESAG